VIITIMPANTMKTAKYNTKTASVPQRPPTPLCSSVRRISSVSDDLSFVKYTSYLGDEEEFTNINESEEDDTEKRRQCFMEDSSADDSMYESDHEDSTSIPFWFSHEEPSHLESVVKAYSRHLRIDKRTSVGSRQLPNFVGRVERHPVEDEQEENENECLTTMDVVVICRRDQRQVGSTVSSADEDKLLLTKWDEDGVPLKFITLETNKQRETWNARKIISADPSFIYCLPVWHSDVDYVYQVCAKKRDVGYAKEPFNFTKYIPKHYLAQVCCESN